MAHGASLILRGLIVERRRAGRIFSRRRMAGKAQQIDVADFQQMHIRRAVRRVAGLTTFDLHRLVLKYERPALFGVACVANGVLRRRRANLFRRNGTVRIVTIVAFDQALVHSMMKGHCELRLLCGVAGVAKLRLFFHQQKFRIFAVVGRMAVQTANIILVVLRAREIHLLFAGNVAGQAPLVNRFRAGRFETENFLRIAGIIGVRRAGAVASFATLMRSAAALVQSCFEMRRFFVALE